MLHNYVLLGHIFGIALNKRASSSLKD